jgi:hypothetical protein
VMSRDKKQISCTERCKSSNNKVAVQHIMSTAAVSADVSQIYRATKKIPDKIAATRSAVSVNTAVNLGRQYIMEIRHDFLSHALWMQTAFDISLGQGSTRIGN